MVASPDEGAGVMDGDGGDGDVEAAGIDVFGEAAVDGPAADGVGLDGVGISGDFGTVGTGLAEEGSGAGFAFAGFGREGLEGQLAELGLDFGGKYGSGQSGCQRKFLRGSKSTLTAKTFNARDCRFWRGRPSFRRRGRRVPG